jgi:hypothetical protein
MMKSEDESAHPDRRTTRGAARRWFWGILALSSIVLAACAAIARSPAAKREPVELSLLTPDAGWEFHLREVRETGEEVWVWAELTRRPGPAAQQLTTRTLSVALPEGKPRRIFVTGKTWAWANDEPYEFVAQPPRWPADAVRLEVEATERSTR